MESELFGHERGAFTGADRAKPGLMELADRGTLFLDEIGELPLSIQPKFLRALQERRFRRVGGVDEIAVNIRVIAATNRDLAALVRQQLFREELLYRIKVARLDIPPLRERTEDIPQIVQYFVDKYANEMGRGTVTVDAEALELLCRFPWPGNVRELQNVVRWSLAMAKGSTLRADDLPEELVLAATQTAPARSGPGGFFELRTRQIANFEKSYLERLIQGHRGDVARAAVEARLPRGTLYRLLKKYSIDPESYRR